MSIKYTVTIKGDFHFTKFETLQGALAHAVDLVQTGKAVIVGESDLDEKGTGYATDDFVAIELKPVRNN
jgi:hypothetical protein